MKVAIYTDAGLFRRVGTWACVVIAEEMPPVECAGTLRGSWRSSTAAEAAAIANALHWARRGGHMRVGDEVVVRTDSLCIVQRIMVGTWKPSKDQAIRDAVDYIARVARDLGINLTLEHVKGHQRLDSRDPHALFNRRCDQLCRAAREGKKPHSFAQLKAQHGAAQRQRDKREALGVWGEPAGPQGLRDAIA